MLVLEIAAGIVIGGIVLFILNGLLHSDESDPLSGCFLAAVALAIFIGLGFLAAKFLFCSDCVLHVTR